MERLSYEDIMSLIEEAEYAFTHDVSYLEDMMMCVNKKTYVYAHTHDSKGVGVAMAATSRALGSKT